MSTDQKLCRVGWVWMSLILVMLAGLVLTGCIPPPGHGGPMPLGPGMGPGPGPGPVPGPGPGGPHP